MNVALGYSSGRLTDLYRECYTDNSTAAEFLTYSDVQREVRGANDGSLTSPAKNDSWWSRLKNFILGAS